MFFSAAAGHGCCYLAQLDCRRTDQAIWHVRFDGTTVVSGHLHMPRATWHDGVWFEEILMGYPREWHVREQEPGRPRQILPTRRTTG
jgi:hypothetical protein